MSPPKRLTADLSEHPDLVVIYLGMRANSVRGFKTLVGFGAKIRKAVGDQPDGLLLHENLTYSLFPPHFGMRQYWRDFGSLERWARSGAHSEWWRQFLNDPRGAGFWHETYSRDGRIESVFLDMAPTGLTRFANTKEARGSMFSARRRMGLTDDVEIDSVVSEDELYK